MNAKTPTKKRIEQATINRPEKPNMAHPVVALIILQLRYA
jgi:hypothetical protein